MTSGSADTRVTLSDDTFKQFQRFIIEQSGLYFAREREDALMVGLAERMAATGAASAQDYFERLNDERHGQQERKALFDLLTIGETSFFRNPAQFSAFTDLVIPQLIQRSGGGKRSIRIWSAGCSSGEEAYTVAICLLETLPTPDGWTVEIIGTDINQRSLELARQGLYRGRAFRTMPPAYLDKYFHKDGDEYRINPEVRARVRFVYHNMVRDPYVPMGLGECDVIFCRNVTIYFPLDVTKRVVEKMFYSLVPEGYLFIGHAETLWLITDKYRTIEYPQTFFYQRPPVGKRVDVKVAPRPFAPLPVVAARSETAPPGRRSFASHRTAPPAVTEAFTRALGAYHRKAYEEAFEQFVRLSKEQPNLLRAVFMQGLILANQGRYEPAVDLLRQLLQRDNLYGEAYYLLGVLHQKLGELDQAVGALQKAVYVDPNVAVAHYQLGEVFRQQQQADKATRAYRNAISVLTTQPGDQFVAYSEDLTVGLLIKVCQQRLESM
ncbi:MAG: tetratricopeptide repeat protein [Nitrospirae bacterium]|nr:tetratricopeptide repeat protein [Nitrospirota bacterium]